MFEQFLRRILAPAPAPITGQESRLALAALMVRIARADGDYAPSEMARIDLVLAERHGLGPAEAGELRAEAEVLESEAPDTVRFTRALKDAVPYEERAGLMRALWSVALVDGARDASEDRLLRMVASLLGVSDRDSALARQAAERQLAGRQSGSQRAGGAGAEGQDGGQPDVRQPDPHARRPDEA